tara:strand:- start:250 stop:363 length:114 start_codon:yes stop_codon:yes gene_type:complete
MPGVMQAAIGRNAEKHITPKKNGALAGVKRIQLPLSS